MSRPLRICHPNLTYHIMSRCIERRHLLNDSYKNIILIILKQTQEKYRFELIHYTILDNHFHLIIRTVENGASISRIMQYLKARVAETYNKHMNRTGPFWNERFTDVIVENQANPARYFLWLLWYLGYNPVRNRKTSRPEMYKYSSINYYLMKEYLLPVKITFHQYFLELGASFSERVKRFQEWEKTYIKRYAIPFEVTEQGQSP